MRVHNPDTNRTGFLTVSGYPEILCTSAAALAEFPSLTVLATSAEFLVRVLVGDDPGYDFT